jgi:hypothetical protein
MDAAALGQSLARRLAARPDSRIALSLFAGTLFLSALLLFSVQPMFARMVLPRLGGSPSVWAVSMCFFQAALLAGYCYAHALNRVAPPRWAPAIHLTIMGVALLALPIGLPATWPEPPAGDAYLWLVGTLAIGVGLPFFAVSANAPLIQAWFARSGHPHANDPYFLYGASNLGSLIALLAYPLVIEPFAGLGIQAAMWSGGFILLGAALSACGLAMAMNLGGAKPHGAATSETAVQSSPAWSDRLAWIGLSAVPSGLLVAYSSYLTTDIASAPFLWVLPLAAFLATFILVFCDRPKVPMGALLVLQPVLVAAVLFGLATPGIKGWTVATIAGTGAFLVTTLVAHRTLYERRPASSHLTEFYLWMSLGGVLGGVFAALVAPQIFSTVWEFPLLLVLGMACRPGILSRKWTRDEVLRDAVLVVAPALLVMLAVTAAMDAGILGRTTLPRFLLLGGFAILAVLSAGRPLRQLAAAAVMVATIAILPSAMNRGDAERSFFGVHRVTLTPDRQMRILMHGTTIHGAERLIDPVSGNPVTMPRPVTYYHPASPMALGVDVARRVSAKPDKALEVGIVGLGAGSMACHSRAGEAWRFYEIDPVVVRIARDPSRFTFLARCRPEPDIVLGDARLTLAKEPAARFDYFVVDAFSSDAVPVHLLTVEALQLYLDKLSPTGLLALHVSNRHLDLVGVAAAVAGAVPGAHALFADDVFPDKGLDATQSSVVYVSRSRATIDEAARLPFAKPLPAATGRPWTDDYSDILGAMLRKAR